MWDVTDPTSPIFLSKQAVHDCGTQTALLKDPEAMEFIPAHMSPTGYNTLISTGAATSTLHVFKVAKAEARYMCNAPVCPDGCAPIEMSTFSTAARRARRRLLFGSFHPHPHEPHMHIVTCPDECAPMMAH